MNSDTIWLQVPSAQQISHQPLEATPRDKLKNIAYKLSALQNTALPSIDNVSILLFFSEKNTCLTNEIFNPFSEIHNSYHSIERKLKLKIELINLSGTKPSNNIPRLINAYSITDDKALKKIGIQDEYMAKAINIGRQSAQRIKINGAQLFVARDINSGNNILLAALAFALMNKPYTNFNNTDKNNQQHIQKLLEQNKESLNSPLNMLGCLGNIEVATLTGSYLCCAHMGLPVLVDGFVCSIAALLTSKLCPGAERWFIYSQAPNNSLQSIIFKHLKAQPLQESGVEFENLAGIISTISLLILACAQHNNNKI